MQTPTKLRPGSLDVPKKQFASTPRTARKLKTPESNSDSVSSPNTVSKTPKDRSPKVVDRRSPRSPAIEKKRPSRVSELEAQLAQLQEELKKAKDQLSSSESWKRKAQQEAEESQKQLAAMSAKHEEAQKELKELSDSEEARVQELHKISQERDRAWQSELEAIQKQRSMDSSALASAMDEIQRLKIQLDKVSESEACQARHAESAHAEIQSLRLELTETLELVEKLKNKLNDSKKSEARAIEEVSRAQMQLEVVKTSEETLHLEHANVVQSHQSLLVELEKTKNRVNSLEELVENLSSSEKGECDELKQLKTELDNMKQEVSRLKDALEAAETRYRDEYIQSTLQIRNAYELVEHAKSESCQIEAQLGAKLEESMAEVEELRIKLNKNENASEHEIELRKSESIIEILKTSLLEREKQLQTITEENETLKSEIKKKEIESSKANDEALVFANAARAAEQEALMKLGFLTEKAHKSSKKTAWATEQLDAAHANNSEMEAELRRLKVQSDQWRKAAETAAAMLSTANNGKNVERTVSLNYHTIGGKMELPFSEDMDEDFPKKKNGNMLRKISVLLKKGHT
ncbi:hypothetical protein RD792_011919 [Penstemon davidsonii]|uniref:Interactor of constitutive active ROPs 2, chloroplastic n=1 Tax=Penstemon davidsonii TaxID=160366 RepID=A0ABR0CVG2_9LAMI|nr:hypothetical protein RD792_011919 [Penstemon davidsonii]